ncbi:hypothetical protein BD289DRAFT_78962 [Coniella lustricola]|uniref:Uncharacterized protein n=1 Tax=Coniella lustricola TaxID=2025994 RepID=A0A2T2ZZ61_9PEZI|nr:hypothetical protein BD289DRAFT_78962 [Coniella lustricola]
MAAEREGGRRRAVASGSNEQLETSPRLTKRHGGNGCWQWICCCSSAGARPRPNVQGIQHCTYCQVGTCFLMCIASSRLQRSIFCGEKGFACWPESTSVGGRNCISQGPSNQDPSLFPSVLYVCRTAPVFYARQSRPLVFLFPDPVSLLTNSHCCCQPRALKRTRAGNAALENYR